MPMLLNNDEIAHNVISRYEHAKAVRGTLDSHLEEIARRVLPDYSGSFNRNEDRTQGAKKTEEMVDATAAVAASRSASALESMLTPRNAIWHNLAPSDKRLEKDRNVRVWFEDLRDALFKYRYAPIANFSSQKRADYMALVVFGTGSMWIDQLDPRDGFGLRYKYIHLGEIYFLENFQGIVDTAFRKFELTSRQAVQQFGRDDLPKEIVDQNDKKEAHAKEQKHWFIHCVKPRSDAEGFEPGRLDARGFPFTDYYVSVTEQKLVQEGGHTTFPYSISRYDQAPGEVYGRSPAMMALPSIKVLNEEKRTVLKQGHRSVDPVILAHDDGVLDSFSMKPGAINFGGVNAEGQRLVHTLPVGDLSLAKEMMQEERQIINDMFLISLFQILIDTPAMTATEVLERTREKGALLSPTMGRQQSEALGPMIQREIDLLMRQGLIDPMPPALQEAEGEFTIEYNSPLSRAQKAEESSGLFRVVDFMSGVINITGDPSALDHVDWDEAMPDILRTHAVPLKWQRSIDAIMALRKGREEAKQQQQLLEQAPALAGMLKQ